MYADGEYDLAGFAVGVVERGKILDGARIRPGDVVIGVASSGLHSNGYSLARKRAVDRATTPTRCWRRRASTCARSARRSPPATSRGWRTSPAAGWSRTRRACSPTGWSCGSTRSAWPEPPVFQKIAAAGVARAEMRRTFNCGLGLVAVVAAGDAETVRAAFEAAGERAFIVGDIVAGAGAGARRVRT